MTMAPPPPPPLPPGPPPVPGGQQPFPAVRAPMSPPPPFWPGPEGRHEGPGHAPHEPHGEHGEHEEKPFSRLLLSLALSIAIVSVLGAIVGWRAETHASKASRFEQDAVAASITRAQLDSEADATAAQAEQDYNHYLRLGDEANRLDPLGCADQNQKTLSQLEAGTVCDMQVVFGGFADPAYVHRDEFDAAAVARDYVAANAPSLDSDPTVYRAQADTERSHEDKMLLLSLGLALALVLLTLARIGRTRASALVLAVPGWLCLVGGAVALGVVEL